MELQISVEELTRALYRAQGIVEKKSTMPILASVLLSAKKGEQGGRLTVSAYDLEIAVTGSHPCEVMREGAVAIKHKELFEIVRSLPAASCTLSKQQNNRVKLVSGAAEFVLVGSPVEDFPALPKVENVAFTQVDAQALGEMIEKTQFAISTDAARYNLNGVYFEPGAEGKSLRLVATDGHRLALIEKPLGSDFKLKRGVIVPRKGLLELRRLLAEEGTDPCELGFAENSGVFRRGDLLMIMRLIDAAFPDYAQVIPKEAERVVTVVRERFLETLRRMAILSGATDKLSPIRCELTEATLRVTSQNPDFGEAKEDIVVEYTGSALKIGFNARYLIDVLSALDSEKVLLELCDELSPGVLKPASDLKFTGVVMPMRI